MSNKFTPKAQYALNVALSYASDLGHSYIGSEHLLLGLLATPDSASAKTLALRGVRLEGVKQTVIELTGIGSPEPVSPSDMTPRTKKIIEEAAYLSIGSGQPYIGTEHLLLSLISESDCVAVRIIEGLGVSVSDIRSDIENYISQSPLKRGVVGSSQKTADGQKSSKNNEKSTLLQYGRDLLDMARRGRLDPIIGRDNETERVIQILSRRTKNNPCLIGEPGVGKTAVVEGLAQRLAEGEVPEILREKRLFSLDLSSMIAGAKYRGEFEERLKKIMFEVEKNPDIIIFIDEIHTIIGAGAAEGAVDAANIIKPALARGELQVIGATTTDEYRRHIEKDAALERRFQPVSVGEPSRDETLKILEGLRSKYESHHKLTISKEAMNAAVDLSTRYITDRFLPDKAIDLIDEAAAKLRLKIFTFPPEHREMEQEIKRLGAEKAEAISEQNFEAAASARDRESELKALYDKAYDEWEKRKNLDQLILGASDIADIVTQWTRIPVSTLLESDNSRLARLEETLSARVIGQENAIRSVSSAIRRGRTGLGDPKRPIGSFIFAGPTGVGKTELCRALAFALFGNDEAMIRLDMSEYMEKHSVSKLIGSPPGYVGYAEGGILTDKIRTTPYAILLFDEIEKAHPDIFNLLLQILDDGILTDSQGRRADFRNSIIIMTTNLGVKRQGEVGRVGFSASDDGRMSEPRERVEKDLKLAFRPEFLNRIDEIILFELLSREDLKKIAALILAELTDRIESNGIFIEFSPEILAKIVDAEKTDEYGARPLRRAVTRLIENRFAEAMVRGEVKSGDYIFAKADGENIIFEKKGK